MKKSVLLGFLSLSLFLVLSCSKDENLKQLQNESESSLLSVDFQAERMADKSLLIASGYDTTNIIELDSCYLLDDIWVFSKKRLREIRGKKSIDSRLGFNFTVPQEFQRMHLKCHCGDGSIEKLLLKAVKEWNRLGRIYYKERDCSLDFSTDLEGAIPNNRYIVEVYIDDKASSELKDQFLRVEGPLQGNPGNKIYINPKHKYWNKIDDNQKQYAIMHALGHCVGLKDETHSTSVSIMRSEAELEKTNIVWNGFHLIDEADLFEKYPLYPPFDEVKCKPAVIEKDKTFTLDLNQKYNVTPKYEYGWCVNPTYRFMCKHISGEAGCFEFTVSGNSFYLEFSKGGSCQVTMYAKDDVDNKEYSFTRTFRADSNRPSLDYPEKIELGTPSRFKISYFNSNVPSPKYELNISEKYFDLGSDNVNIKDLGKGEFEVTFNDYGAYIITAKVVNAPQNTERKFYFTKLYRPEYIATHPIYDVMQVEEIGDKDILNFDWEHYAQLKASHKMTLDILPNSVIEHRMVYFLGERYIKNHIKLPERVNREIIDKNVKLYTSKPGDNGHFEAIGNSEYTKVSEDYTIVTFPFELFISYPENDRCELGD